MRNTELRARSFVADCLELAKARICVLALVMTALGYGIGSSGAWNLGHFAATMIGIALVGASCGALNQYLERDVDALMNRTRNRPLPTGRMNPKTVLRWGGLCGIVGVVILGVWVSTLTAVLAAFTEVFYVGIYTPSKRLSSISTLLGAVPGAMPPLLGFTAARGELAPEGLVLFGILFLWQIPHFLAIAWVYREDYARGGFPILTVIDEKGGSTAFQITIYLLALLPLTLVPSVWGVTGPFYFVGAILLGVAYLAFGLSLAYSRTKVQARRLFFMSLVYLPCLGLLMVWDRVTS